MERDTSANRNNETIRLAHRFHRFSRWSLAAFGSAFALLFVFAVAPIPVPELYKMLVGVFDVLLLIVSAAAYALAMTIRDVIWFGHKPWRFSHRSLLIITTAIAVSLGLLVYAFKN